MQTSPKELLIKIGTTYRVWQLLRLTCKNIYVALGDHSAHAEIIYYRNDEIVSRTIFMRELIDVLKRESKTMGGELR